ncbi:MAG: ABC transporter permease [Bryobacteraceae bacterium]
MRDRIREIVRKEFFQMLREPRMRVLLFVPPMIQLIIFGYAVNLDIENAKLAWLDQDRTPQSRELRAAFELSPNFTIAHMLEGDREVQTLLDGSKVQAVIRILPGFEQDIVRGRQAQVQILVDGSNSNTASLVSNYASTVVAEFTRKVQREQSSSIPLSRGATAPANVTFASVTSRGRVWFNPELRSRNYFVPGVIVNIIMVVTMMLTCLAIVREKEIGTLEQLMVTPIRPIELMIGKTIPFAIVGLFDLVLVTTIALLVFHIPFRGSPLVLLVSSIFYLMTTLGAGLFISTVSNTQQQAMMSSFFFLIPAFMLSGFAFPIRNMPVAIQYLTYLNPLRYFVEIVRGVFLKGVGPDVLWPQMTALFVYGSVVLVLSALRFHKRLD